MTSPDRAAETAWVLFDGRCGLCDGLVRWLIRRDRRARLRFAPLEGEVAAGVRSRWPDLPSADETMVLVESPETPEEVVRVRSRAALGILVRLGGLWRVLDLLAWIPSPLLDAVYRFVAARRAKWFGRLDACRVPAPWERERFLDVLPAETDPAHGSATISPP